MNSGLLKITLALCCVLATCGWANASPAKPSTYGGRFLVTQGTATYDLKISVPPGTGAMQPNLKLSYSSSGDEGLLGSGFRLDGLSEITRCRTTLVQDGTPGRIGFNDGDVFCLDAASGGGRLIRVNDGPYYTPGTPIEYRTEIESFRKIVPSQTACGNGPCSFTIWLKDGRKLDYAAPVLALAVGKAPIPSGTVRVWKLSAVEDLHGNAYSIAYTQTPVDENGQPIPGAASGGVSYPTRIDYTSGNNALVAQRSVQFGYSPWPDAVARFVGGARVFRAARLSTIKTCVDVAGIGQTACAGENLVRQYEFAYNPSAPKSRSRLSKLTECDGAGSCMAPLQFEWSKDANDLISHSAKGPSLSNSDTLVGDFDGNGLTDLLSSSPGTNLVYLRKQVGFTPKSAGGLSIGANDNVQLGDFNGDGLTDVLTSGGTNAVYLSSGTFGTDEPGFVAHPISDLILLPTVYVGDVDGDGSAEVVTAISTEILIYRWNGTTMTMLPAVKNLQLADLNQSWLADFNGDGRADLLLTNSLYLSTGNSFAPASGFSLPVAAGAFNYVGDFNGDGNNDFLTADATQGMFFFGSGAGFSQLQVSGLTLAEDNNWVGDFNGDGRSDLFSVASDGGTLQLSNGVGFDSHAVEGLTIVPTAAWIGDFNGDGRTDLTSFAQNSFQDSLAAPSGKVVPTFNQKTGVVTTITNGVGGRINIRYQPITDDSVYEAAAPRGSGQLDSRSSNNQYHPVPLSPNASALYPAGDEIRRSGMFVVSGYEMLNDPSVNNLSYSYTRSYSYQSAAINLLGRGWLGFGAITILDPANNATKLRQYRQDFPFVAEMKSETTSNTKKKVAVRGISHQFECMDSLTGSTCTVDNSGYAPNDTKIFRVAAKSRTTDDHLLGTSVSRNYSYDDYGNATLITDTGDTNGSSRQLYTCHTYLNDVDNWQLGYKLFTQRATADCSKTPTLWGDSSLRLSQLVRDPKTQDVLVSGAWLDSTKYWYGRTSTRDSWGNITGRGIINAKTLDVSTEALPNSTYTTTIDADFHSFAVQVTTPVPLPTKGSKPLTTYYAYDSGTGKRVAKIGPNSESFVIRCSDGFGRLTALRRPAPEALGAEPDEVCVPPDAFLVAGTTVPSRAVTTAKYAWNVPAKGPTITNTESKLIQWPTTAKQNVARVRNTTRAIDGLARTTVETRTASKGNAAIQTTRSYQNSRRKLSSRSLPYRATLAPGAAPAFTFEWDPIGRPISQTIPYSGPLNKESSTTITWSRTLGQKVTQTWATATGKNVAKTLMTYDYYGPRRKLVASEIPGSSIQRSYSYTALGEPYISVGPVPRDGKTGLTVTLGRDTLGRLTSHTQDNFGETKYKYDLAGNLSQSANAIGQTEARSYDNLQRLITSVWKAPGKQDLTNKRVWDVGSGENLVGRVASFSQLIGTDSQPAWSSNYSYDTLGRPVGKTSTIDSVAASIKLQHSPQGRPTAIVFPDGSTANYAYNDAGALSSITTSVDGWSSFSFDDYNAAGSPRSISYGNGASEQRTYTADGGLQTRVVQDKSGTVLLARVYQHDSLGQLNEVLDCLAATNAKNAACASLKISEHLPTDRSRSFTYENRRLDTETTDGGKRSYSYDPIGNLYQINGETLNIDGQKLACKPGDTPSYCHDAAGKRISASTASGKWNYDYDATGSLESVSRDQLQRTSYAYATTGRRVERIQYSADGTKAMSKTTWPFKNYQTFASGTLKQYTNYLPGPYGVIASWTRRQASDSDEEHGLTPTFAAGSSNVYSRDQTGSTQIVLDQGGSIKTQLGYQPYGKIAWSEPQPSQTAGSRLFGGLVYDQETGLYRTESRDYDPEVGRFLTPDDRLGARAWRHDAFQRFAYVLNNPISYVDPSGHRAKLDMSDCAKPAVGVGVVMGAFSISSGLGTHGGVTDYHGWGGYGKVGGALKTGLIDAGNTAALVFATCKYVENHPGEEAQTTDNGDSTVPDPETSGGTSATEPMTDDTGEPIERAYIADEYDTPPENYDYSEYTIEVDSSSDDAVNMSEITHTDTNTTVTDLVEEETEEIAELAEVEEDIVEAIVIVDEAVEL